MKPCYLLFVPVLGLLSVSCEPGGSMSSGFDPLDPAGGGATNANVVNTGYKSGEFVTAVMDNTGFFNSKPKGDATADKLLRANTQMKVIADDGSFVKVELDDGNVGYVSTVQVMGENEGVNYSGTNPGETQVWPPPPSDGIIPLGGEEPVDPSVPTLPIDVDPDAPVDVPPLPPGDTSPAPGIPPLPDPVAPEKPKVPEGASVDLIPQ